MTVRVIEALGNVLEAIADAIIDGLHKATFKAVVGMIFISGAARAVEYVSGRPLPDLVADAVTVYDLFAIASGIFYIIRTFGNDA